jgi:hypothetical protein
MCAIVYTCRYDCYLNSKNIPSDIALYVAVDAHEAAEPQCGGQQSRPNLSAADGLSAGMG